MALSATLRNAAGTAAVFAVFFGALQIAPDQAQKHAELRCDYPGPPTAVFSDMAQCVAAQKGKWQFCGCHRPHSVWASLYVFGLVPVATAVAGVLLLVGRLPLRLALLNVPVIVAIVIITFRSVQTDPAASIAVPFVPFLLLGFCLATSAAFLAMHFKPQLLRRPKIS
jgi:hypothetical protein